MGKGETTNLSYSATFRKTKDRLSSADLVHCRFKRRQISLRILPQEGAGSLEQWYPYKIKEHLRICIRIGNKVFLPERELIKIDGGDCYFK